MRRRVSPYIRRRHLELHGLQDNETETLMDDTSGSDNMSITSSNSVLSPQTQNDNQDDEMEEQNEPPNNDNDNDSDGTTFDYRGFGQMDLPDTYKRNFADLAWKARCNVSDNAYDQMKYTKNEDFWSLRVCRKRLFDISGIETIDFDCCWKGKCASAYSSTI